MPRHARPCARARCLLLAAGLALLACGAPAPALAATTPLITSPAPGSFVGDPNVHVTFSESDPGGTSSFDVYVSQPDCSTADGPQTNVPALPLVDDYAVDVTLGGGDGPYCITIVAHDVLVSDPPGAEDSVTLDTTPPAPPGSPDAINPPDQFPTLEWGPGVGDHGGSGVATYTVYRDGVPVDSQDVGDGTRKTYTDGSAPAGTTGYTITVTDVLGHESAPAAVNARYDGPSTSIDSHPLDPSRSADATFGFSASEPGTFRCSLDADPDADCPSPTTLHGIADGDHTFHVHAVDVNGTAGPEQTFSWSIDTAPARLTLNGPSGLTNQSTLTYTFSSDDPGSTFTCQLDGGSDDPCTSPQTYPGLADGPHHVAVTATDTVGNHESDSRDVVVDTTAPGVSFDQLPPATDTSDSPTFAWHASEDGVTYSCRLDGGALMGCDTPKTFNHLSDGGHELAVQGTDPAGNTGPFATYDWTIDSSAPETTIDSGPSGSVSNSMPVFTFHSNDPVATFECQIDGGGFLGCTSPDTLGPLADGQHTFQVRAVDAAGNPDPTPDSQTFTVDTTAPETTIDSGPASPTNDRTPAYTFSSDDPAAHFECSVDGADFAGCTSGAQLPALADGSHTFQVRAGDAAGNVDPTPDGRTLVVDTDPPTTTISSGPPAHSSSTTATFEFGADEPATFQCRLDGGAYASCSSPWTIAVDSGDHSVDVRATDTATNVGQPATYGWTVDVSAPNTTITGGPSGPTASVSPSFSFSSNDPGATFLCSLDGAAFTDCASPTQVGPLLDGAHSFAVEARDGSGNVDPTPDQRSFVVDTTPPDTTIAGGPNGPTSDSSPTFTFSSPDSDAAGFECSLNIPGGPFAACPSTDTLRALPDGPYTLYVRAVDGVGNADASPASRSFTVDTVAPSVTIDSGPPANSNDPTAAFSFHASEGGTTYACQLDGGAITGCDSPETYTGLHDGHHTFAVRATDPASNVGGFSSTGWTVDATAPDTTIDSGPPALTADATPTFTFSSNDGGATFECSADAAPFAACHSPYQVASLADGPHTFDVRARDAAGNVDASPAERSFTVDTLAPDTTIEGGPTGPVRQATFSFDSPDTTATFECSVDAAAFSACTSPVTVGGLADGAHTFAVRARDAVDNVDPTPASRAFTLDAEAPVVTIVEKPANPTNQTTATFTFTSDPDVSFTCQLDGQAPAACDSGVTYPGLAAGGHTFKVKGTDLAGNVGDYQTYQWTIDLSAPELDITGAPATKTNLTTVTFSFSSPASGASFRCTLAGPTRVPEKPCFGAQTYPALHEGPYTFTVVVTTPAGNHATQTRPFLLDVTAPGGTFPALPDVSHGTVQFAAKPVDRGSPAAGVASVAYTYSGAASGVIDTSARAPWTVAWNTAGLPDGTYTIHAVATDQAGNAGTIPTVTTQIDNTGPAVSVTLPARVRQTVNVTAVASDSSNVVHLSFMARDAAGTWTTFADSSGADLGTVTVQWATGGPVLDGAYLVQVLARDTYGNERTSLQIPVVVDNSQPSQPGTPTAAASPTRTAPMIAWPGNTGADVDGYDVYRGGDRVATQIPGTSFADALATNGTQDGVYAYTVQAVDLAGNRSAPSAPVTVVFDTTPPAAPAALTSSGQGGTVGLSWQATADPSNGHIASGLAGYVVRRASGAVAPAGPTAGEPVCSVPAAVTSCADVGRALGVQLTYAVFAVDAAGNVSTGAATSVTPRAVVLQGPDKTPTARATKLKATVKASRASLSWANPKDADFDHVQVVVNTKRAPRSPSDGRRIYRGKSTHASFLGVAGTRTHVAIFAYDHAGNVSAGSFVEVRFARALLQPLTGTLVNGSPRLSWKGVKGAAYYNVQVFLRVGRKRVAIAWPHATSYHVPAGKLTKGKTYVWYVWPGYGKLKDARYGKLIGSSTFVYR